MAFASSILSRAQLAANMGYQYGGDRDIYQALGYDTEITFEQYAARYERQDIAKAIINRPVSFTWKGNLKLIIPKQEKSPLEVAWNKLERELNLKSSFVRLDKLSCIGEYGVLLLGFDDIADPEEFKTPVKSGTRKLLYIRPLAQNHAMIATSVTNPRDKRYGMPEVYKIQYQEVDSDRTIDVEAHYSRILHVVPELSESQVKGAPVLRSVWNRLMDLEKLVGGSAEMFWRGARPGYQGKVKEDYMLPTNVEAGLQDQLDEFEHNLRRIFVNEGVELEALMPQVSDPASHVDIQIQMISAVTGIPKRILVGSERGELSSAQDVLSWYDHIQTRREEYAERTIVRPFVSTCMKYNILPSIDEYAIQWSDLFASSEKDKAEVGRIRAMALREYTQNPLAEATVPPEAFFEYFLGLSDEEREVIKRLASDEVSREIKRLLSQPPTPATTGGNGAMGTPASKTPSFSANAG